MIILTVIVLEFDTIRNLYKNVAEIDISFESRLDELDKYRDSNNIFSGLDVINTYEKYKDNDLVKVCLEYEQGGETKKYYGIIDETKVQYTNKYYARLEEKTSTYQIVFRLKETN